MFELSVTCSKVYFPNAKFKIPRRLGLSRLDHLLVANETDIGVAEPTFVCRNELQDQLPSIPHLRIDHNKVFWKLTFKKSPEN